MSDFSANLQLLCQHHRSIAAVCRAVGINRAQFNRYLNGQSRPSPYNLQRLAAFFALPVADLQLPHRQFEARLGEPAGREASWAGQTLALLASRQEGLARYQGYYLEYYPSLSTPGMVLCGLVRLFEEQGVFRYVRFERLRRQGEATSQARFRYLGLAMSLESRLFFTDYESLTGNELSQTVLLPSARNRIDRLNGLKLGVSASDRREPACTRVVWEYLGTRPQRGQAYGRVGLYDWQDARLDEDLRQRLGSATLVERVYRLG
ncbi:helix-turn-helix domain-containing protein [Pseudomonas oryzihabitans]|uniref:helix-turn-helix domain-containing protein n=1 Tax=Pseudomonas oryzihabitans TaxID=47885 RepID=UPI0011A55284|nr:helix-turn-helix transcriptional regulator [Pseudomonas psychrotolerans]